MNHAGGGNNKGRLPLVSACITSYNSAEWLPRAIDSVLRQRTEFGVEIVIGDDSSADGTQSVIRRYQQEHPDVIRVPARSQKLGMQRNYFDTFEHCRGKYVAWLDADDYWTSTDKLARQVEAMESDSTVSVCGHFVRVVSHTGEVVRDRCPVRHAGRYSIRDIISENLVPSPSIMFRNGIHRSLPESFFRLTGLVDWPILLQSALAGDVLLLDSIMADYMLTPGSAYTSKGPLYQDRIDLEFFDEMDRMLPCRWQRRIRAAKGKRYEAMSYQLLRNGDRQGARETAHLAFRTPHVMDNLVSKIKTLVFADLLGGLRKRSVSSRNA